MAKTFQHKPTAPETVSTDTTDTLATKGYVDGKSAVMGNLDGGKPWTNYGGMESISGGGVTNGS